MNDAMESKKARDRSPSFPFIDLEFAIERARQFYTEEKRGAAPYARAAMHWRYSPSSSGALQTAAALKSYGLMSDAGQKRLQLTDLALRILLDVRPDSAERKAYIRQAAMTPAGANDVYSKWPEELPSEATLNHYLVLERKFNQLSAVKAAKILQQNQSFAGVIGLDKSSESAMIDEDKTTAAETMIDSTVGKNSVSSAIGWQAVQDRIGPPQGRVEQLIGPNGEDISIRFGALPTKRVYEFLKSYAEFKSKECLTPATAAPKESGGSSSAE